MDLGGAVILLRGRWWYPKSTFGRVPTVSEDQKKQLQTQLWNIANELRGKMNADEFRDYILGFIFYKYLSEKIETVCRQVTRAGRQNLLRQLIGDPQEGDYIEAVRTASTRQARLLLGAERAVSSRCTRRR